jgi:hypothetical protein
MSVQWNPRPSQIDSRLGSDVRKADHFRYPDELLVGEADSRAVLTSPPRLKRSEPTDSDAEQ